MNVTFHGSRASGGPAAGTGAPLLLFHGLQKGFSLLLVRYSDGHRVTSERKRPRFARAVRHVQVVGVPRFGIQMGNALVPGESLDAEFVGPGAMFMRL